MAKGVEVNPAHVKTYSPVRIGVEAEYAREVFEEIQRGCPDTGWAPITITWSDLAAWQQVTGTKLTPWMRRLVFLLNSVYRVKWIEKQKTATKPK